MKNQAANNGTFILKPGFTVVQNNVARDWSLSSGALGLYTRIQSYITMENITLTKGSLMERVSEGEYAFNTAWNELKSNGYLFIHVYPGEKGRFVYQYELRPDNCGWDGAYLFYHDRNGNVKSTNLTRKQSETAEQPSEKATSNHYPNYHPGGNHHSGNHCGGNRGSNIKLNHKEKLINTNLSISPASEGATEENVTEDIIRPALAAHKGIPLAYMAKPAHMQAAIHYLTGYDFRQQHPYQANGVTDDARQSAFALLNTCLSEMCCATGTQTYRGALVTADKVLAEISRASNGCEEDGLEPYVEDVLDTFLHAISTREVKNLPQYMKSLLWTSFATYRLNTISGITAPYKEVTNVYGLH